MERKLSNSISSADYHAQYDAHARNLLKDKTILSYILKYAVSEFASDSLEQIEKAIEDDIFVASLPVRPGSIVGDSTESNIPGEGKLFYDIRFHAYAGNHEKLKLIINLEAQKDFYPGYDLVSRGIVYGARMISEQIDTEFTLDNYDGVKKVYSIWVCMNTPSSGPVAVSDSITEFSFEPHTIYGNYKLQSRYDLISVVFLCLSKATVDSDNMLISLLSQLLSPYIDAKVKKKNLENNFHIKMSDDMIKETELMCNLSYGISDEAFAKGKIEGMATSIITILNTLGTVDSTLERYIFEQTDSDVLTSWLQLATKVSSITDFENQIGSRV